MAALALLSQQQASFLPQFSSPTAGLSTVASTSRQPDSMTDSSAYLHYLNLQRSCQRQILENSSVTATSPPNFGNLTPHFDLMENSHRNATSVITALAEENKKLRTDLEGSFKKALKLQQLELQYQKISRDYDDLVKKQEKRDQLEQQMHRKMQLELKNLTEINNNLNDQLELCYSQMDQYQADNLELRQELERLIAQSKELFAIKERQEVELEAQRDTLEEQRAHIVILDKALSNAQEKVLKLDEESVGKSFAYLLPKMLENESLQRREIN
uniref:Uncharacterized protein n=1 Tax=Romanomermis culicivorax TaxID=13658 RepID=A0A915L6K0_ROMCU